MWNLKCTAFENLIIDYIVFFFLPQNYFMLSSLVWLNIICFIYIWELERDGCGVVKESEGEKEREWILEYGKERNRNYKEGMEESELDKGYREGEKEEEEEE